MGSLSAFSSCCCEQKQPQKQIYLQLKPKHTFDQQKVEVVQTKKIIQTVPLKEKQITEQQQEIETNPQEHPEELIKLNYPSYFQIYLTTDQSWYLAMQNNGQFPLKMDQVYKQLSNDKSKDEIWSRKVFRRSTQDNKKVQLLFKQHVPLIGRYFFQIDLISFLPSKKCDFTIGVVSYEFAKDRIHSRDSPQEQSYTYIERRINIEQEEKEKPVELNMRFKVQITRQEQPQIVFYINGVEQRREKLKETLAKDLVLVVPYIQTQYEGVVLSWKSALKRPIGSYKISTIFQEPSSVISA